MMMITDVDNSDKQDDNSDKVEGEVKRPINWEEVERENQLVNLK